jgi:hypothetical protein
MKQFKDFYIVKKIAGITLILIGIPGLFLPFLQGIFFITTGLILLGNKTAIQKLKKVKRYIISFFFRPKR